MYKTNKKGVVRQFWWFFRIPLLIFIVFFIIIFRGKVFEDKLETGALEHSVLVNRVFKTFAYQSPNTGRIYPNIIDEERFTQENLEGALISSKNLAAKVSLNKQDIYLDKDFYELSEPLKGISKYSEIAQSSPVQILTKDKRLVLERIDISIMYQAE